MRHLAINTYNSLLAVALTGTDFAKGIYHREHLNGLTSIPVARSNQRYSSKGTPLEFADNTCRSRRPSQELQRTAAPNPNTVIVLHSSSTLQDGQSSVSRHYSARPLQFTARAKHYNTATVQRPSQTLQHGTVQHLSPALQQHGLSLAQPQSSDI